MITVKILCQCGTKFAFEVDETLTLSAGVITCPNCGADASSAANTQIAAARSVESTQSPPPATSHRVRLSLSPQKSEPAAEAETETSAEPEEASEPHRAPPPFSQSHGPSRSEQRIRRNREEARRRKPYIATAVLLLVAAVCFWFWYAFFGSQPKVAMDQAYNRPERPLVARLLSDQSLLLIRNRDVSLLSAPNGPVVWQKSFGDVTNFDDSQPNYVEVSTRVDRPTPGVRVTSNSFWIVWPDKIVALKRDSGDTLRSLGVPDPQSQVVLGEQLLLVQQPDTNKTEEAFNVWPLDGGDKKSLAVTLPTDAPPPMLIPDGRTVVTFRTRLLERNIVTNKLFNGPKVMTASGIKKSPDNNFDKTLQGVHTAAESIGAAVKLVHELNARSDDEPDETYQDLSRYAVEIERSFGGSSSWKGEITGQPRFFPLVTVDVLAGEQRFKVIDKNGRLKWEAPLSYPLSGPAAASADFYRPFAGPLERPLRNDDANRLHYRFPFVEEGNRLYAYDSGVLACFDLDSGNVQWRVTSVGIRKIIFDRNGYLYACTTQDGPDTLKHPQQSRPDPPVDEIIKVDPKSGSVLWHASYLGTDLYVSGKFIYSKWVGVNVLDQAAALSARSEALPSCAIARINPANGKALWRRDFKGDADAVNVDRSTLMIQFTRRVEVLKFFSL